MLLLVGIGLVLDRVDVLLVEAVGAVEVRPVGSEYVLVECLEPHQVLFFSWDEVLDQVRPLRLWQHVHVMPVDPLTFHLL